MKRKGTLSDGRPIASTWLSRGEALSEGAFKNTGASITSLPSEAIAIFTKEIAHLFRQAGREASVEIDVRFLMPRGKQGVFAELVRNLPKIVAEFLRDNND